MTQPKHTPGPWRADAALVNNGPTVYAIAPDVPLSKRWGAPPLAEVTAEADAALIAAAPKMLAALDMILFAVTDDADTNDGRIDRGAIESLARAAIREATGETE